MGRGERGRGVGDFLLGGGRRRRCVAASFGFSAALRGGEFLGGGELLLLRLAQRQLALGSCRRRAASCSASAPAVRPYFAFSAAMRAASDACAARAVASCLRCQLRRRDGRRQLLIAVASPLSSAPPRPPLAPCVSAASRFGDALRGRAPDLPRARTRAAPDSRPSSGKIDRRDLQRAAQAPPARRAAAAAPCRAAFRCRARRRYVGASGFRSQTRGRPSLQHVRLRRARGRCGRRAARRSRGTGSTRSG